jgi:hypothetical protein
MDQVPDSRQVMVIVLGHEVQVVHQTHRRFEAGMKKSA